MTTTKKLKIALPGSSLGENSFGAGKDYLEFISYFGNPHIILPDDEYDETIDAILLPGGADMSPSSYTEAPRFRTGNQDVFKTHFFENKLKAYIDGGKKIIGICLGMQQLAVLYGSKLTQHFIYHPHSKEPWDAAHCLVRKKGDVYTIMKNIKVNSRHHQGIVENDLADVLQPLLFSENEDAFITGEKYIVEAFKHKTLPVLGLQWHPENFYDKMAISMISDLLFENEEEELQRENGQASSK